MWLIEKLQDPALVVEFQRLCGIREVKDDDEKCDARATGEGVSEHQRATKAFGNGKHYANGQVIARKQNGHHGHAPNGVKNGYIDHKHERENCAMKFTISNHLLYYIFNFGASLGNEIFYITFLPSVVWNMDAVVARKSLAFWALYMYLGQATKDLLKIPRPPSPPVVRLEDRYALEYGMPSTHAMVGAGLPFSYFFLTLYRYQVG